MIHYCKLYANEKTKNRHEATNSRNFYRPQGGIWEVGDITITTRAEQLGQLGLPGYGEAPSGMGGASLTSEVPGVNKRRFSSEFGYVTLPQFPQCEHSPKLSKCKNDTQVQYKKKSPRRVSIMIDSKPPHTDVKEMPFGPLLYTTVLSIINRILSI